MSGSTLSVCNLRVSYGDVVALNGVTFECNAGDIIGIIGPNGAGKSTLIKAILGLVKPEHGDITLGAEPMRRRRAEIAYVPQRSDIDWDYPAVVEQVAAMGRYPHGALWRRTNRRDRMLVVDALERVGMSEYAKTPIGELSGGQQQRVFLARALAQQASLLLLDEPFAAIDAVTRTTLWQRLHELAKAGRAVLIVHHEMSSVNHELSKLLLLAHSMVAFGTANEVLTRENIELAYGELPLAAMHGVASPHASAGAPRTGHERAVRLSAAPRRARLSSGPARLNEEVPRFQRLPARDNVPSRRRGKSRDDASGDDATGTGVRR